MRHPIGRAGSTLDPLWYNAQGFGTPTSYGYHEGEDYNLRSGGDSDLGQPLYAVANGIIKYFHNSSHPTTGFGRHMVLECLTSRGKRWYNYAHCDSITAENQTVSEGQIIGRLGKTGNSPSAHLHFATFRVDPNTLPQGIDTIAKTTTQLNSWWEKFDILATEQPIMAELHIYLGVTDDTSAKARLKEHLGEHEGKCDWGNEAEGRGGFLGSARREIKDLRTQLQKQKELYSKLEEDSREDREFTVATWAILQKHEISSLEELDETLTGSQSSPTLPLGDDIIRVLKRIKVEL